MAINPLTIINRLWGSSMLLFAPVPLNFFKIIHVQFNVSRKMISDYHSAESTPDVYFIAFQRKPMNVNGYYFV